jgi:NAD(P)H-dependent FMN reductase
MSYSRAIEGQDTSDRARTDEVSRLVAALRDCDGVIVSSPAYHGTIFGLVKKTLSTMQRTCEQMRARISMEWP